MLAAAPAGGRSRRGLGGAVAARARRAGARPLAGAAARAAAARDALAPRCRSHVGDDRLLGGLDLAATLRAGPAGRRARPPGRGRRRRRAARHGGAAAARRRRRGWRPCSTRARSAWSATGWRCGCPPASAWWRWTRASAEDERPPAALARAAGVPRSTWTGSRHREATAAVHGPESVAGRARAARRRAGGRRDAGGAVRRGARRSGIGSIRAPAAGAAGGPSGGGAGRARARSRRRMRPLAARLVLAPRATALPPGGAGGAARA